MPRLPDPHERSAVAPDNFAILGFVGLVLTLLLLGLQCSTTLSFSNEPVETATEVVMPDPCGLDAVDCSGLDDGGAP